MMARSTGWWIGIVAAGLLLASLVVALMAPNLGQVRPLSPRVKSAANLHAIGKGIELYCGDPIHNGAYPLDLSFLVLRGSINEDHLQSPLNRSPSPIVVDYQAGIVTGKFDSVYHPPRPVAGGKVTIASGAEIPIGYWVLVHERPEHGGDGLLRALFGDYKVHRITPEHLEALLQAQGTPLP